MDAQVVEDADILIHKCLSPAFVTLAHKRGNLAMHIACVVLAGAKDRSLMPFIRQGSFSSGSGA